jgi:hypothetical protein
MEKKSTGQFNFKKKQFLPKIQDCIFAIDDSKSQPDWALSPFETCFSLIAKPQHRDDWLAQYVEEPQPLTVLTATN